MTVTWPTLVPRSALAFAAVAVGATLAVGCGEKRDDGPMSEGRRVSLNSGCSACHGANGEGGMGPKWKGLYGSQVTLDTGEVVTADDTYLTTAIKDPSAQKVQNYSVMPPNTLSDAEVQAIVDYIKSLSS